MMLGNYVYAQKSDFNKDVKISVKKLKWGRWFKESDGSEIIMFEQTPDGYYKTMIILNDILTFYTITDSDMDSDETSIEKNVNTEDNKSMSTSLLTGNSLISKMWKTENINLVIICDSNTNSILLDQKNNYVR